MAEWQNASVSGLVKWNGGIRLMIHFEKQLKNGRWVEREDVVNLDVDQLSCVRRTFRHLAQDAIARKRKIVEDEETNLNES